MLVHHKLLICIQSQEIPDPFESQGALLTVPLSLLIKRHKIRPKVTSMIAKGLKGGPGNKFPSMLLMYKKQMCFSLYMIVLKFEGGRTTL